LAGVVADADHVEGIGGAGAAHPPIAFRAVRTPRGLVRDAPEVRLPNALRVQQRVPEIQRTVDDDYLDCLETDIPTAHFDELLTFG